MAAVHAMHEEHQRDEDGRPEEWLYRRDDAFHVEPPPRCAAYTLAGAAEGKLASA
ncbi:MAG TPA: hypothetical protein VFC31_01095 [Candidatus Limnocylindria bacterium]|nr:hypothetical protein [Candidatus Limnocylindria bacterium]